MYGDCQVLSAMEMNSPESIFSSQMQNPNNLGFLPFHAFSSLVPKEEGLLPSMGGARETTKEEEMDSGGSGSGNIDGFCSFGEEELEKQQVVDPSRDPLHQPPQNPGDKKKKRYHRHTAHQIQEMEALFKECPHPDDKQRLKLSQELGLKPRQVKFWFQNRRTQMKAQQDRSDNLVLRAENESLKHENFRLQGAIRNVACPSCGSPAVLGEISFDEQHLRIENARLKDELERLACIATRYTGRPLTQSLGPMPLLLPQPDLDMNIWPRHFNENPMMNCNPDLISSGPPISLGGHTSGYMGPIVADQDKPFVLDLAVTAVSELIKMGRTNDPLWVRKNGSETKEVLNLEEYKRGLQWPIDVKQHDDVAMCTEATRDTAVVIMNSITLVDAFLDANKWMELFPSIVSKARTVQVIMSGISGQANGSLILMSAELQFLSPLVPAREFLFFRYAQQNPEEGTWALVDFPADGLGFDVSCPGPAFLKCRRRPSGCVIQDMPNGYSRVTWVEHCEVEDKPINPAFYKFVKEGSAFGATRFVSHLQRQCERLASLMARNVSDLGVVIPNPEARKNLMKLSQRMIQTFCMNISSSGSQSWTALSESQDDTIRVTTRKNTEPGQPNGVILTAVSTTWLPTDHFQVFELLTDEQKRSQLDILSSGNSLHEVAHIANGSHPRNCVSLLRINAASNSSQNVELLLQESSTHSVAGSLVVFATVDIEAVQVTMSGEDPSFIPLLPMGFVISPSPNPTAHNAATSSPIFPNPTAQNAATSAYPTARDGATSASASEGCLLTVGMQVLASAVPSAKLSLASVTAINNHINNAVRQISTALGVAGQAGPAN